MLIGERLAQRPARQRDPDTVRRTVLGAAREICRLYIAETAPHLIWFDESLLFPLIRWNVLPLEKLAAISEEYNRRALGHVPPWMRTSTCTSSGISTGRPARPRRRRRARRAAAADLPDHRRRRAPDV